MIRKRLRTSLSVWQKVLRLLSFSSRRLSLIVVALALAETVAAIGVLYLIKRLVDIVSEQLQVAGAISEPRVLFVYLGVIGLTLVLAATLQRLADYFRGKQGMEVADYVDREIHERAIQVDLAFYESPLYHDSLQRARMAGNQRPAEVIATATRLLKSALFLVAVLALLAMIDWRLLPVLLASMLIALGVRMYYTYALFDWKSRRAQLQRRAGYLDWLLTSDHHAKELRINGLGPFLRDRYSTFRTGMRAEELAIERRKAKAEIAAAAIAALVFFAATVWIILNVVDGAFQIGDLVLFLLLFRRAETSGREFISAVARLYDDQLFLRQLFDFLSVEPQLVAPARPVAIPPRLHEGVRFHGVSFRYPSADADALSDIDFELRAGKVTALVGENGSGKTSLLKLMCRLYDPDKGLVTLDGIDIRTLDPVEYRKLFSIIFQDYAKYAETARENIRYGDVSMPLDTPRVEAAARLAGAESFIETLPKGFDTPLARLFDDGRELSLGQWQRVALARAFFPPSQFLIMDEPTSAVDPRAEAELFDDFRSRLEGRGALIISHRLSTIRMADHIYVLGDGRVLEHGSHDELVAENGSYARLFERQARHFR